MGRFCCFFSLSPQMFLKLIESAISRLRTGKSQIANRAGSSSQLLQSRGTSSQLKCLYGGCFLSYVLIWPQDEAVPRAVGVGQLVYALHKLYLLVRWKAEALGEWSR